MSAEFTKSILLCIVAAICLSGSPARAEKEFGFAGAQVAYGIGFSGGTESISMRHNLDLGVRMGWIQNVHSSIGMWDSGYGWLLGASCATGFGTYPSYVMAEFGYGWDATLAAISLMGAAVFRAHPDFGAGVGLRIAADIWLLQPGIRFLVVANEDVETQLTLTLGFGRF